MNNDIKIEKAAQCPICGQNMKKEKMPRPRMLLATNPLSTLLAKKIVVWYCEDCNRDGKA